MQTSGQSDGLWEPVLRDLRRKGACRGNPDSSFFEDDPAAAEAAREVCRACSVQIECALTAIGLGCSCGVWGGLDASERQALVTMLQGTPEEGSRVAVA